jgi:hypothetical protein
MKQPHKHRDLIIAWANGEEIQVNNGNNTWDNLQNPSWYEDTEYRIKPEVIKYRNALYKSANCYYVIAEKESTGSVYLGSGVFIKYLTDWIEVEV